MAEKIRDCVGVHDRVQLLISSFPLDTGSFYENKPDVSLKDGFSGHRIGFHNRRERGTDTRGR